MTLSDMITAVGEDIDRNDIDTKITEWIQDAINWLYNKAHFHSLERSVTGTTTTDDELKIVPADFSEMHTLEYAPGDGTGYVLNEWDPMAFFKKWPDQNSSGYSEDYCIYQDQIILGPRPTEAMTLIMRYRMAPPNINTHDLTITDNDNAATAGVQVYLDEDAYGLGYGKLYFVSPNESNALVRVETAGGHTHDITIFHSASAATLGVAWYFDDDATTESERNLFVGVNGIDCVVRTNGYRKHGHFVKFTDTLNAASLGSLVYCDEDEVDKKDRLLSVTANNADATSELTLTKEGELPPFAEKYHEAIKERAVGKGHWFNKNREDSRDSFAIAESLAKDAILSERRSQTAAVPAKSFSARRRRGLSRANMYPEIDDGLS